MLGKRSVLSDAIRVFGGWEMANGITGSPGRFFASMELKLILAHLIMDYEIKWPDEVYKGADAKSQEEGGYRPPDIWFDSTIVPNRSANILIRKRNVL